MSTGKIVILTYSSMQRRSITLSLVAIISLATINQPDPTSVGVQNSDVAHFVTILVVTLIFVISYRIFKFLSATKN